MRILGVDPGLASTGMGVIELRPAGGWRLVESRDVKTTTALAMPERLDRIYRLILVAIEQHQPQAMAVESVFFAKNVRSAVMMAHGRGAAILAASNSHIPVFEYSPLEIKQSVVGKGRAGKHQVMEMVRILLNLDAPPASDHQSDAIACALTHAFRAALSQGIDTPAGEMSDSRRAWIEARRTAGTAKGTSPAGAAESTNASKELLALARTSRRKRRR